MIFTNQLAASVAADLTERVVDLCDASAPIGDGHDRMHIERGQESLVVPQGHLQIQGHVMGQSFRAQTSTGLLPQHGRQQCADQGTRAKQQPGKAQIEGCVKGRSALHVERHTAPRQLQGFAQGVASTR